MTRKRASAWLRWVVVIACLAGLGVLALQVGMRFLWPEVVVTHTVEAPVVQAFYATATLEPEREYSIRANSAGILTQVFVDKGNVVHKGQPLAEITDDAVIYQYDQAKADRELKKKLADEETSPSLREYDARLQASEELLEIAWREQRRITQMLEQNVASQSDLDQAIDRVKTLWAEVERLKAQRAVKKLELEKDLEVAEAALKIAQWNLDQLTIRSPIDSGAVLDRPLSPGTRVGVNDHIMQIADVRPERLVMRAAVDEEDKTQVRLEQLVHMTLYAFPGRVFEGRVKKIYDKADPDRRTFEIDVEMTEKNGAYAAGMTGELAFIIDQKERAMVIPSQAVQGGDVWVVHNGRLEKANVVLGLRSVERAEVVSGLGPGSEVVISPVKDLEVGQRVRSSFMNPTEAAALNTPQVSTDTFKGFN